MRFIWAKHSLPTTKYMSKVSIHRKAVDQFWKMWYQNQT